MPQPPCDGHDVREHRSRLVDGENQSVIDRYNK
jgi:hypothetical protein